MHAFALPIRLQGSHGSPYTRKALAVLRYRRLPYRFIIGQPGNLISAGYPEAAALPLPKVALLPTFYFKDADGNQQAITDTTPILRQLESLSSERKIIPPDPVLAFLNYLIEDYADEWLTRCMFHYRWNYQPDIDKASAALPFYIRSDLAPEQWLQVQKAVAERQISRLYVVGSNTTTAPVIEQSYERFLQLMEQHLQQHLFLMGGRPGACDFAVMGQLTCLTHFDPTPTALCVNISPRTYAWVERAEDLSGFEVSEQDWLQPDQLPPSLEALLQEIARTHMPQLLANAKALEQGETSFQTRIEGQLWEQPSFPYQKKCLLWIRQEFEALSPPERQKTMEILSRNQLEPLISEPIR
ncbi:MAG: glutathione S-transferase family protein [Gammaproteobacteria bacterium]